MDYESFSSFRTQRDKKSNNPKYSTHSFLLSFLKKKKKLSFENLLQNCLVKVRGTDILERIGKNKKWSKKPCLNASLSDKILMVILWARMWRQTSMDIMTLTPRCSLLLSTKWRRKGKMFLSGVSQTHPGYLKAHLEMRAGPFRDDLVIYRKVLPYLGSSACVQNKTSGLLDLPS